VPEPTRRWQDVLAEKPVNEARAAVYERVLEAEARIARACTERGIEPAAIQAALDAAEANLTDDDRREDLYLSLLGGVVAALGGRLEVRAVFDGDQEVVLRRLPADAG
jgi:hypothetical protein